MYTDLILLKALFIEELHEAIMEEDKEKVKNIMSVKEIKEELSWCPVSDFDIKEVKAEHLRDLETDLSWTYSKIISINPIDN